MQKTIILTAIYLISIPTLHAQTKLAIWNKTIPNSTTIQLSDSVSNERMYQVSAPYLEIFTPEKAIKNKAAVLIIPGGGYARLAYDVSGKAIAKWLIKEGFTAFVLYYRLPHQRNVAKSYLAPLQDAQRAMKIIKNNELLLGIDKNKIGVLGTSAGGHLASCLCTFASDWSIIGDSLDSESFKPNFSVLISPVISMDDSIVHKETRWNLLGKNETNLNLRKQFSTDSQVNASTPPTLVIHAANDPSVSVINSLSYYNSLIKNGVKGSSIHIFPQGGHSISMETQPGSTQAWSTITSLWIRETINLHY